MSTVVILIVLIVGLTALGVYIWFTRQRRRVALSSINLSNPKQRKLTRQERDAVEQYLRHSQRPEQSPLLHNNNFSLSSDKLTLTAKSENVFSVTNAITRYGLASETHNKSRYFIDTTEIHLPPFWEQYIAAENHVELIKTQSVPLVISLNGHSLANHIYDRTSPSPTVPSQPPENASIRQEDNAYVELLNVRKETNEEQKLTQSNGVREAAVVALIMVLLFVTLIGPVAILPWMLACVAILIGWLAWRIIPQSMGLNRKEIHCLRGMPKRLGLFGESNQGDISNISLGVLDLVYPAHWQPYINNELGQKTDIDVYVNQQVVRQGNYLSLHDEVKNFPLQHWGKNLLMACCSFILLAMMFIYVPLSLPFKLSVAWLQGAQTTQVSHVEELEKTPLRVGDILKVKGNGMCYVPPHFNTRPSNNFAPFDCSGIYWNEAAPLPIPESETVEAANALLATLNNQLHPANSATEQSINPQLATAIEKSGMILLDDFSDIVLKTQDLCGNNENCVRLKNALVNLGNADNWAALVKRAQSGSLKGMNVLLRPVSAQMLSDLANTATASFFTHETLRAAEALNSPPPGGFLISNDEGKQLVAQPAPSVPLFNYNPQMQWAQLQSLSTMLLHAPFTAQGVITNINTDANGTRHISLHSEPDISTLWRYLGTSLLLVLLAACMIYNVIVLAKRIIKDKHRIKDIQDYYNHCFNPTFMASPLRPHK